MDNFRYMHNLHKHNKQRKQRGFSDIDLEMMGDYLFTLIPQMIEAKLEKETNPKLITILKELNEAFKETDYMTCSFINTYSDAYHNMMHEYSIAIKSEDDTVKLDEELVNLYSIEEDKNGKRIIITEIPYKTQKNQLVFEIDKIVHSKAVDGLLEVRDESDWKGIRIVIDCKKDAKADLLLQYLMNNKF